MKLSRFFAGLLGLVALFGAAVQAETPLPELAPAIASAVEGERACVEPTDFMRRNHMDLILHQRDETMHNGIRTKQHALKECINCHVTKGPNGEKVSVHSRDHFCSACHAYAAVSIDCFDCHASQPEGGQ